MFHGIQHTETWGKSLMCLSVDRHLVSDCQYATSVG